jgi:hypothetical protein
MRVDIGFEVWWACGEGHYVTLKVLLLNDALNDTCVRPKILDLVELDSPQGSQG